MAAFGKIASLTNLGHQSEEQAADSRHGLEFGLRLSELPGAAFATITLLYVVVTLARLVF
jgi:hypothetical protein